MSKLTELEEKTLDVIHRFPLGLYDGKVITGRWFKEEDLEEALKELFSLKQELLNKKNEQETSDTQ